MKYSIFAMKDADYTSMIMSTYGSLQSDSSFDVRSRRVRDTDGSIVKNFFVTLYLFKITIRTDMALMIITTAAINSQPLKQLGKHMFGKIGYLLSS